MTRKQHVCSCSVHWSRHQDSSYTIKTKQTAPENSADLTDLGSLPANPSPSHWCPSNHLQREAVKNSHNIFGPGGKIQELTNPGMYFTVLSTCIWIGFSSSEKLKKDRNGYNVKWTSAPSLFFLVIFKLHVFTTKIKTILFPDAAD